MRREGSEGREVLLGPEGNVIDHAIIPSLQSVSCAKQHKVTYPLSEPKSTVKPALPALLGSSPTGSCKPTSLLPLHTPTPLHSPRSPKRRHLPAAMWMGSLGFLLDQP